MRGEAERPGRAAAGQAGADDPRGVAALLHRHGAASGTPPAAAMSPIANTSGWLGSVRSPQTTMRPAPSRRAPEAAASGDGSTPAAHRTVRASMRPPSARSSPSGSSTAAAAPEPDVDTEPPEVAGGAPARGRREVGQQLRPDLHQRDRRPRREPFGELDAGRSAADDGEAPVAGRRARCTRARISRASASDFRPGARCAPSSSPGGDGSSRRRRSGCRTRARAARAGGRRGRSR